MFGVPQQLPRYRNLETDLSTSRVLMFRNKRWIMVPIIFIILLIMAMFHHYQRNSPTVNTMLKLPSPTFAAIQQRWLDLDHLIVVPGHGIQWCTELGRSPYSEDCWYLASYQRGQVVHFMAHLKEAIERAKEDPRSLLIMSGGQTRPGTGARNEARSYFQAAEQLGWLQGDLYDRTVLEEHARDSLENVMFTVCRFHQVTGRYPSKVTIFGFPFKSRRFINLHRQAAKIKLEDFDYVGVELDDHPLDHIVDDAYPMFEHDLYGCQPALLNKRIQRNPYRNQHGYVESCPEMAAELTACK